MQEHVLANKRLQLRLEIEFIYNYLIIGLLRNFTIKCFKIFRYIIKSMVTFSIDTNTSALSLSLFSQMLFFICERSHTYKMCYLLD